MIQYLAAVHQFPYFLVLCRFLIMEIFRFLCSQKIDASVYEFVVVDYFGKNPSKFGLFYFIWR